MTIIEAIKRSEIEYSYCRRTGWGDWFYVKDNQLTPQTFPEGESKESLRLNIDDILKDPKGVRIPDRMDQLYITMCMLASLVKDTQLAAVDTYIGRVGGDMRVMVVNRMAARWRKEGAAFNLPKSPQFKQWVKEPEFSDLIMGA